MDEDASGVSNTPGMLEAAARVAFELNGVKLTDADLALAVAEFERALEIARPLLEHDIADGLDLAGVYRP